jgi:2-dehydropantoate 2-reductase
MPMRYLIMGAGALGSVFGGLLGQAGHQVAFLGRGPHFDHLRSKGLTIDGIWGKHRLPPVATPGAAEVFDVILLCVKSFDSREAVSRVRGRLAPDGLIISIQNGLGNLEVIAEAFGEARTMGARVIFGAQVRRPGRVTVTVYADKVLLGPLAQGRPPQKLAQVASDLDQASIPAAVVDDVLGPIWNKVLYNCALNPLGAILGVPYGALGDNPQARKLMRLLIEEIYRVAAAMQVSLPYPDAGLYFRHFLNDLVPPTAAHWPSMWQDLQQGRRTEIDALNGAICRYGAIHGVATPYNDAVSRLVKFLQVRSGGRQPRAIQKKIEMAGLHQGNRCPRCREGKVARLSRPKWMHWLPASKYYQCEGCRARFLTVYGWTLRLPGSKGRPAAEK